MKFNQFSKLSLSILTAANSIFLLFINLFSYNLPDGSIKTVSLFKILAQREDTISLFPQESNGFITVFTVLAIVLILAIIFFIQFSALELLKVEANSLGLIVNITGLLLNLIVFIVLLILNNQVNIVTLSNVHFLPLILAGAFTLAYVPLFIFGPKDKEIKK